MGAVLAVYKDRLVITPGLIALCWVSFFLVRQTALNVLGFYLALFLALIYASSLPWILALKPRAD